MNVTFAHFGDELASSRLRARIPQQELAKLGIVRGNGCLVYGKHWLTDDDIAPYKRRVFDVCDDHFDNAHGAYYRRHIAFADAVTCNSAAMQQRIKAETGRDATVIPEPYEGDELEPTFGPTLFWYGHRSNLPDLDRVIPSLRYPLLVMSNHPRSIPWSRGDFLRMVQEPSIVIIPTGKSMAKSENRMVEAIRCGKYVCAEHLPSYEPFERFYGLGDIAEGVERALSRSDAVEAIRTAQDAIREPYSPETVAKRWLAVIETIH